MHYMKEKNLSKISTIFIMCAAVCWGSIGIFARVLSSYGLDPVQITFLRCSITALTLIVFSAIFRRDTLKISGKKNILLFLGSGGIGVAVMYVCYFATVERATLSLAAVLLYTAPCIVMVMSCIFFKEKITAKKIAVLIVATIGCVLSTGVIGMITGGALAQISVLGIFTGLGAGFSYALYTIIGNQLLKTYSSLTVITYSFTIATLCLLPFSRTGETLAIVAANHALPQVLPLSLGCTLLPYVLYTFGLKHTEPSKASIMALVEPVVATIISIFYFHEGYTMLGLIGIAMIFGSIVVLNLNIKKTEL